MTAAAPPWRLGSPGLVVRVRVTPRAAREEVEGVEATADGPAVKVRVRAVPEDGAANAAVIRLVADWLGIPKSMVSLASGARSRVKTLAVAGDGEALAATASRRLGAPGQGRREANG